MENSTNLWRSTGTFCSCASSVHRHPQRSAPRFLSVRRVLHRDWREARMFIAPDLFNGVIDQLMRRLLSRCNLGIQLGEYQLTDLDYADDIAIFAPSACVLQEALTILQEEANLVGMQISWPKTKLMAITPKPTNHLPLKICNKEVVFIDSFTYLGSLITNDGSSSRDITSRIAKTTSAMCRLSNPLFRKHRISIRTKINMYRALVVSVLLYGSEAWATTLADRRRLDVFDMRCQRRVFWQQHVSNQSIRERTKQPTSLFAGPMCPVLDPAMVTTVNFFHGNEFYTARRYK